MTPHLFIKYILQVQVLKVKTLNRQNVLYKQTKCTYKESVSLVALRLN